MSVNSKMTAVADQIRGLLGLTGTMGLDAMAANLATEKTNITNALTALAEKGVTVPAGANSGDLAELIAAIEAGGGGVATGSFIGTTEGEVLTIKHNLGRNPQGAFLIWDYNTNGAVTNFAHKNMLLASCMLKTGTGKLTSGYIHRPSSSGTTYSGSFTPSNSFSGVPNGVDYTDARLESAGSDGRTRYGAVEKVGETMFMVEIRQNGYALPSIQVGISYKWVVW